MGYAISLIRITFVILLQCKIVKINDVGIDVCGCFVRYCL